MGSRYFKNKLRTRDGSYGNDRRDDLVKEVVKDGTPFPKPLEYKNIDEEFKRWVDEELKISFEGKDIPTISLFTNQRFTEYMQSWQNTDDKKNILMNFKIITRENNPKTGNEQGNSKNIPGDYSMLLKRVAAKDKNNREYYIDYRMKQPFTVDLVYKVSIVTNKYEMINKFNLMVNERFKAIDCYIRPNGHFIPMKLNEITDESEYKIDDRQYYSQSYNITVMAYIIPADSFITEEKPKLRVSSFDIMEEKRTYAEIEEFEPGCYEFSTGKNDYYYKPMTIKAQISVCNDSIKFHIDTCFVVKEVETENIRNFRMKVNDEEVSMEELYGGNFRMRDGDEIKYYKINRLKLMDDCAIILKGYNDLEVYDKNKDNVELIDNLKQYEEEIIYKD